MNGSTVTALWEAPVPGEAFCFEQQTLPEPPEQRVCVQQEFPASSIHVQKGKGAPQDPAVPPSRGQRVSAASPVPPGALGARGCHRLAVHGWDTERGWATFALWHRYTGNGECGEWGIPARSIQNGA